jgi:hypothetical protein
MDTRPRLTVGAAAVLLGQDRTPPDASSAAAADLPVVTSSPTPAATATAHPSPSSSARPPDRPRKIRIDKVRAGQCVDREPTGQTFETLPVVPCGQAHDLEIYAIRKLGGGRWPGNDAVQNLAEKACRAAFQTYVGVAYDESTLEIGWYTPTAAGWGSTTGPRCAFSTTRPAAWSAR